MTGEFYFMALGGLGVSLAGFAGLISALDRRPEGHSPIARWRIRNIVVGGFSLTFLGFGIIAVDTMTGDEALTTRIASLSIAVYVAMRGYLSARPGPAWPDERRRFWTQIGEYVLAVVALGNVVVGGVGYLQLLLLVLLFSPASIFVFAVRSIGEADVAGRVESQGESADRTEPTRRR